jgi:hypothetical protein
MVGALEVEASVFDPHHPSDVGEVLNYVTAMNFGLKRLEEPKATLAPQDALDRRDFVPAT